jgi:hypothetical protein
MEPTGARRSGALVAAVASLGTAVAVLVVLASSSGSVRPVSEPTGTRTLPPMPSPGATASPTFATPTPGPNINVPEWIGTIIMLLAIIAAVLVGVGVVLLLALLVRWLLQFLRQLRWPEAEQEDDDWERVAAEKLTEAVDSGLVRIGTGDAADAIIACWVALEAAAAAAGVPRREAETPSEFTVRVLALGNVSAVELGVLADLYREARFSAHRITEAARDRARSALERLRDELGAADGAHSGAVPGDGAGSGAVPEGGGRA